MAAAIGWYGPLIDLSKASSYVGDYVQLLVFVHKSTPVQYKIARNGGEVVRTDILVGDETRLYFPVTIWQKQMGSQVLAGHVFLLQNLKITRFGDAVEARALHCSSLQCLLHPNDFAFSKGLDELIAECRIGITAKDKLQKVVGWLQRARLAHCGSLLNYHEEATKSELESARRDILSEVLNSVRIMPVYRLLRLQILGETNLADDLITTGCELCGIPVDAKLGSSLEQNAMPLYCQRSSDRLHVVGTIYRPFLLYVWDDSKYLPILVTNKAAELLFGNIPAEKVYSSYNSRQQGQRCCQNYTAFRKSRSSCATTEKMANPESSSTGKSLQIKDKNPGDGNPNFYMIWLILLNMLFQHGKNSPLKFKVTVDTSRDWESGRLEMESVSTPAFRRIMAA